MAINPDHEKASSLLRESRNRLILTKVILRNRANSPELGKVPTLLRKTEHLNFGGRYPDVQVDMNVGNRPVDLIAENLDCVLRLGPLLNDSLIARPAGTLTLVTCAAPEYLSRQGTPQDPSDLGRGHTIVRMASPRTGRDFVFPLTRGDAVIDVHGAYQITVNDSGAALAAGIAGLGVLTIYEFLVRPHLQSGALQRLFSEWHGARIPVHVAYPANRHLASKVRVFVDWAIEILREG